MHRSPISLLIPLLSLLLLLGCQADEERIAEHMTRGDAYFEEKKYDEATIEFKSVLQIDPNHATAHYGLARTYLEQKKSRDAFWELRESVRLDSTNNDAKLQLAQMLIFGGELEESLMQADEVLEVEPERVEAFLVRGQVLEALKRPDEALEAFERAVELGPEDQAPTLMLAHAYVRRGDRETAEVWFRRLTEIAPTYSSHAALARFLIRSRDRTRDDEVEAAYRQAIEVAEGGERPRGYTALANFFFARERYDDAMSLLEQAIEEEEDTLDLIYALARFHHALGDTEKADALITKATEAAPDQARPFLILSAYRNRKGDLEGALEGANKALEIEPDNKAALLRKADVLIEMGVRTKAPEAIGEGREIVEAMLAQEPTNSGALLIKAKVDLFENRLDDSVTGLRAAIDARPDWAQAHFMLGTVLSLKKEDTAARAELARALEIDASLVDARRVLAQVHSRLGESEYAVEESRRYLREKPEDVGPRVLLAQSLIRMGKREDAIRELESIPESERNAEVNYAFGRIAMSRGEWDEARVYLGKALDELPTNYDILRSLIMLDRQQERPEDSAARIDAALEQEPTSALLHQLKGMIAFAAGRPEDGVKSLARAIELDPNELSSYERLARYYTTMGRLDEAIRTYESAVEKRPDAGRFHHLLGILYEYGGQPDMAIERYEEAIKRDPNLAAAKNNLAYLYADSGENLDRALDLAQEAKALLPESPHAADTLGWVLYKRGVPSAAISYLKEAQGGLDPASESLGTVLYHLALAYEANGDRELARSSAQRALETLESRTQDRKQQGSSYTEPAWANQARAMLDRIGAAG